MELSHSQFLVKTPDLSRAANLERLVLEGCTHLHAVEPSLADLKKLIFLSLTGCINLRDFQSSIELESLQILILSVCSKLRKFPEVGGYMKHLSELFLDGTAMEVGGYTHQLSMPLGLLYWIQQTAKISQVFQMAL